MEEIVIAQGTTPEHTFTIPVDTGTLSRARVVYVQNKKRVIVKYMDELTFNGNTVKVQLSQAETFMLDHKKKVKFQLRSKTKGGDVLNSEILEATVAECIDKELI